MTGETVTSERSRPLAPLDLVAIDAFVADATAKLPAVDPHVAALGEATATRANGEPWGGRFAYGADPAQTRLISDEEAWAFRDVLQQDVDPAAPLYEDLVLDYIRGGVNDFAAEDPLPSVLLPEQRPFLGKEPRTFEEFDRDAWYDANRTPIAELAHLALLDGHPANPENQAELADLQLDALLQQLREAEPEDLAELDNAIAVAPELRRLLYADRAVPAADSASSPAGDEIQLITLPNAVFPDAVTHAYTIGDGTQLVEQLARIMELRAERNGAGVYLHAAGGQPAGR